MILWNYFWETFSTFLSPHNNKKLFIALFFENLLQARHISILWFIASSCSRINVPGKIHMRLFQGDKFHAIFLYFTSTLVSRNEHFLARFLKNCDLPLTYKEICIEGEWDEKCDAIKSTQQQQNNDNEAYSDDVICRRKGFPWGKSRKITQINSNVSSFSKWLSSSSFSWFLIFFLFHSLGERTKGQKRWHGMIMFAINFFLSLIYLYWQTITHSPTCKSQALFK